MMMIAKGVKKSIVSREWIREYLEDMKVDNSEIKEKSCCRRFWIGARTYLSEVEVRFPIVLKKDNGDYIKRAVRADMIDADRVNFLLEMQTMNTLYSKSHGIGIYLQRAIIQPKSGASTPHHQ